MKHEQSCFWPMTARQPEAARSLRQALALLLEMEISSGGEEGYGAVEFNRYRPVSGFHSPSSYEQVDGSSTARQEDPTYILVSM